MRKTIILAAAVLAMAFSSIASTAQTVNNFTIKRGTNISHWLSQTPERGEARRQHIKEEDFARLEELGFDFVRIPIDEEQFWDEQGNKLFKIKGKIFSPTNKKIVCDPSGNKLFVVRNKFWHFFRRSAFVIGADGEKLLKRSAR